MNITMVGIDHNKAGLTYREKFSFTKAAAVAGMERVRDWYPGAGCIILSTCNRTELWFSDLSESAPSAGQILCLLKDMPKDAHREYSVERSGRAAVNHLFELSCGLKSQVFGEDQIITQVGEALELSRECHCAGVVLERLFRSAVTYAKKVKTEVRLTVANQSVAVKTAELLREKLGELHGVPCLVIGNGEMGRLAAMELVKENCQVFMTLRQYKRGEIQIPCGCQGIDYEKRGEYLQKVRAVVSATASPHFTLWKEDFEECASSGEAAYNKIAVDLAVPRDIDPKAGELEWVELFDIDTLGGAAVDESSNDNVAAAKAILEEGIAEFEDWYGFKDLVPIVNQISETAADEINIRVDRAIRRMDAPQDQKEYLKKVLSHSSMKVVARLMYGLKETLDRELWEDCIVGIEKAAER